MIGVPGPAGLMFTVEIFKFFACRTKKLVAVVTSKVIVAWPLKMISAGGSIILKQSGHEKVKA